MTEMKSINPEGADPVAQKITKLAIMAVGGQGGGVLGGWIEATARSQGFACQSTSVAGVAQRTGSTVYYIEMAPKGDRTPVFSLAPSAGDVDILIAAELMEAGRSVMRGFITPDRTAMIASSHRVASIAEKMVPGDGLADEEQIIAVCEIAAQKLLIHNLDKLATDNGSVISASLFGALAGMGVLPFPRDAFEEAIRKSGKGVEASLRAFGAAYRLAETGEVDQSAITAPQQPALKGPAAMEQKWKQLQTTVASLPEPVRDIATAGLAKVVDFQSLEYGEEYLNRLRKIVDMDTADKDWRLSFEAAKYIANAMTYDDLIRVADIKTRASRMARVHGEIKVKPDSVLEITEYMHPRAEEIVSILPRNLGSRLANNPKWMARLDRLFNKGRRVSSNKLTGFAMLYVMGGMRGWRLRTLRHAQEQEHLDNWLKLAMRTAKVNYNLGAEILCCRRLIKGYSDTHSRGHSKFSRVIGAVDALVDREDGGDWLRRLRSAALQDEKGEALDGALETVASFT